MSGHDESSYADPAVRAAIREELAKHRDERDVPAYCTCGQLTTRCPVQPREWIASAAWYEE